MRTSGLLSSPEYTIIVTGCSGRGKSTFCNFLFREKRFVGENPTKSKSSGWGGVMSTLSKAQYGVINDPIAGVDLHIIDTPGYLATQNRTGSDREDMAKDGELVLQEFANALMYAKDGIDAIFVTLKAGERVAKEEELLMQFIEKLNLWQHCILLFTHGREVGDKEEDRYRGFYEIIEKEEFKRNCPVLVKMLAFTSNRFVIVESVGQEQDGNYYRSKVDEIIKAVAVVRNKLGAVINHPLLRMARTSWEMYMKQERLEQELQSEEQEKRKITERFERHLSTKEMELAQVQTELRDKKQKLQETEVHKERIEKLNEEMRRLEMAVKTKEQEVEVAKAEVREKAERDEKVQMLIVRLEEYMQRSNKGTTSECGPGQILVNYLKKMDDNPGKFVDAYSELEALAEKQKETDALLDQLSTELDRFGFVRKTTVKAKVDAIKGGQSPVDDQSRSLNPSTVTDRQPSINVGAQNVDLEAGQGSGENEAKERSKSSSWCNII